MTKPSKATDSAVGRSHRESVAAIINDIEDRTVQEELYEIYDLFKDARKGICLAAEAIAKVDAFTGSDHYEFLEEMRKTEEMLKSSELLIMRFSADAFIEETNNQTEGE